MSASTDQLFDAEQQWETFGIPRSKLAKFSRSASSVVDQEEIERARPLQVARACRPLFDRCDKKSTQRLSSKHAFTLYVIYLNPYMNDTYPLFLDLLSCPSYWVT